jgi:hypothetical protein
MAEDQNIREISVDFARTIAQELAADEAYCRIENYGRSGVQFKGFTQRGEDMIERYIRRAIFKDRERRP